MVIHSFLNPTRGKKLLSFLLCICMSHAFVKAQPAAGNYDYTGDIDYFSNHLISGHKNLYSNIAKTEFDSLISDLKKRAADLTFEAFIVELFRINSKIADEHTRIDPVFEKVFPFRFDYFDEGLGIIFSDSSNSRFLMCRVLTINNHPMDTVLRQLTGILKKDNDAFIKFWVAAYCNKPLILRGLGLIDSQEQATFRFLTPEGDTITDIIKSVPAAKVKALVKAETLSRILPYTRSDFYWYESDSLHNTMYFDYARCAEDGQLTFKSFNTSLFAEIARHKPGRLIVDLRFNDGGNSSVMQPFLESIKGNYLNTKGSLYVLVGRNTFSSALMNAIDFARNTNAIMVGEPTGANINHFGEVKSFQLPSSKITVYYSTKFWNNWPGHNGPLLPDIAVGHSYFKFLNATDEAVEYVLKQ